MTTKTNFLIILIILISLNSISMTSEIEFPDIDQYLHYLKDATFDKLVKQVNDELTNLNTQFPANIKTYVGKMHSKGRLNLDKFPLEQTESTLKNRHGMPDNVVQKFKGIVYAAKVTYKTFNLVIDAKDSYLDLIVGGAGKTDNIVEIAYMRIRVDAQLIPMVNWINHRECHTSWFRKKCKDNWVAHPRGYTVEETLLVKQALEAQAFRTVSDNIRRLVFNFEDIWFNELLIKTIAEAGQRLDELAQIAYKQAMHYVYEAKLLPLIFQLKAMLERANNYADTIVRKAIESYKNAVKEVVDNLTNKFIEIKDAVYYTKEYLFTYSKEKVEALKDQLSKDYQKLVEIVNEKVYKLNCAFSSIEYSMKKQYREDFESHEFTLNRETCVDQFNKLFNKSLDINYYEDFTTPELYEVNKCVLLTNIKKEDNAQYFYNVRTYSQLVKLSSEMKCLSTALNSQSNIKYYNKEMMKFESDLVNYRITANKEEEKKVLKFLA